MSEPLARYRYKSSPSPLTVYLHRETIAFTKYDAVRFNRKHWWCSTLDTEKSLFIGNLPDERDYSLLQTLDTLDRFGRVTGAVKNPHSDELKRDNNKECSNFCFVEFDMEEAVSRALRSTPIKLFGHHKLFVQKMNAGKCLDGNSQKPIVETQNTFYKIYPTGALKVMMC